MHALYVADASGCNVFEMAAGRAHTGARRRSPRAATKCVCVHVMTHFVERAPFRPSEYWHVRPRAFFSLYTPLFRLHTHTCCGHIGVLALAFTAVLQRRHRGISIEGMGVPVHRFRT